MHKIVSAWRTWFGKARLERELDEELRGASQALEERYVARGMIRGRGTARGPLALGGIEPVKDAVRDVRVGVRVETFVSDVRYAARALRKSPAFTAAAVLSLALGIGANAAIFTFINALMLRPLPVREPSSLVELSGRHKDGLGLVSFPMFRDLSAQQQVLTGIVATAGETPYRSHDPVASRRRVRSGQRPGQLRVGQLFFDPRRRPGARPPLHAGRRSQSRTAPRRRDRSSCSAMVSGSASSRAIRPSSDARS